MVDTQLDPRSGGANRLVHDEHPRSLIRASGVVPLGPMDSFETNQPIPDVLDIGQYARMELTDGLRIRPMLPPGSTCSNAEPDDEAP